VKTAALGSLAYFRKISPEPFKLAEGKNEDPVQMDIGLAPSKRQNDEAQTVINRGKADKQLLFEQEGAATRGPRIH